MRLEFCIQVSGLDNQTRFLKTELQTFFSKETDSDLFGISAGQWTKEVLRFRPTEDRSWKTMRRRLLARPKVFHHDSSTILSLPRMVTEPRSVSYRVAFWISESVSIAPAMENLS